MTSSDGASFQAGSAAIQAGDWAAARAAFERALEEEGEHGRLHEGLGRACYGLRDYAAATASFERAFASYRDEDNDVRAAFIAGRWLAFLYGGVHGNEAAAGGWLGRAQHLLAVADATAESGWVELMQANFAHEHAVREECARRAMAIAESLGDRDLEFCALAYIGESVVFAGRIDEGMGLLDQSLAACSAGEVTDFVVVGEIYCKLFGACEYAHDVVRAEEWLNVVDDLGRRRNLIGFTSICLTHYGGILTAAGRWSDADEQLNKAVRGFEESYRALGADAIVRLADLRVRQGRLEEAGQLLAGLEWYPSAARPLAALHLALGEFVLARDILERALSDPSIEAPVAAPLLALLVDVDLARDAVEDARESAEHLSTLAERNGSSYLVALAALARGRVCVALGTDDARPLLEEAASGFARTQLPLELARTRLDLARALSGERSEVAIAEAKEALKAFESLPAARYADEAGAFLRSLGAPVRTGPKGHDTLTKREAEILELVGHGLSNRDIADRLFISARTVEHHVGRVLLKLGLRRRAEAVAYAVRSLGRP